MLREVREAIKLTIKNLKRYKSERTPSEQDEQERKPNRLQRLLKVNWLLVLVYSDRLIDLLEIMFRFFGG